MRLTTTSNNGVDTADRADRAELTEGKSPAEVRNVEAVLEAFAAERLLILAADTVEISHEVLLTAWPLLRDTWLAETHADRIVRSRLHNVATDWTRDAQDPSYLYSGSLRAAAAETAARIAANPARYPPLSQAEEDFLRASDRAHRRGVRRRQSFTAFLLVLVVGLASVTALALRAQHEADYQREIVIDAARAWFVDGGKAELQLLSARADAVGYAATSTYPKLGRACSSLATAVKTAQADPPIPNAVAQQWFARALAQFKVSAADCQLAVAAHSVALVNKAAVPMRAANEDVSEVNTTIQND